MPSSQQNWPARVHVTFTAMSLMELIWLGQLQGALSASTQPPLLTDAPTSKPTQPMGFSCLMAEWTFPYSLLGFLLWLLTEDFTLLQKWRCAWNRYMHGLLDLWLDKLLSPSALSSFTFLVRDKSLGWYNVGLLWFFYRGEATEKHF